MGLNFQSKKSGFLKGAVYMIPPISLSLVFYYLSLNEISLLQLVLAIILLVAPWTYYLGWKQHREPGLPVFSIISFMYWIYFAPSLFWGARTVSGEHTASEAIVSEESVTAALVMSVIAISCMWLGMKSGVAGRLIPKRIPLLKEGTKQKYYVRVLLVVTSLLSLSDQFTAVGGEGARQMLSLIVTMLPIVAFCLLFRAFLRGEARRVDIALLVGFLLIRFVMGLASGWLGSFASIVVICGAVYLIERRKVPRVAVVLVVLFTLFFQVGKKEFRSTYWQGKTQASKAERVQFWAETSLEKWGAALTDPTGLELSEALNASLSRVSLLTQTSNVVDLTPRVVPYQYLELYSYMAVTLVPRAIWPNKPSMNEANRFYQVAYGLSDDGALENVSIAVGVMTEAYISFGWLGVIGIMFLMGIFYDLYQRTFFGRMSGSLMFCVGVALIPQFISIEAQMAAYLGGIIQQVVLTLIVFLPVMRLSKREQGSNQPKQGAVSKMPRTAGQTVARGRLDLG